MAAKRKAGMKIGIVAAWRKGETDLAATIESASQGLTAATVYAVEDRTADGPARTRHRGIEAAGDCDTIIVIDAHMRFSPGALESIAKRVRKTGGLACASAYHNAECAFTGEPYRGGRIVYRAQDGKRKNALCVKWARDAKPGPRGCVIGAVYAFPRAWYYDVGQPLAALPGWGCDEEALSIAAWLSGRPVECLPQTAAHRYRERPPWQVEDAEHAAVHASRMALIHCVVSELNARRELEAWQRSWVPEGIPPCTTPEAERFRAALLRQPRTWREWRAQVCEPDEIDGRQDAGSARATPQQDRKPAPIPNPVATLYGVECRHCRAVHDPHHLKVSHTYPNGNRRHICPTCRNPFMSMFRATP